MITNKLDILAAFSRALSQEAHVLLKNPDLLWQQLFNRLQWEWNTVKPVLIPALSRRVLREPKPWLRLKTPYRESQGSLRTLEGHTNRVKACAFSPDGRFILSGGSDDTLRLWDPATGILLLTIQTPSTVTDCSFSPDGRWIISAIQDNSLRIWDVNTGELLQTIPSNMGLFGPCSISPDGAFIVSQNGALGHLVGLWHINTGRYIHYKGHMREVMTCAFSPDGCQIVSGSSDKTIQIWDASPCEMLTFFPDQRIRRYVDNTFAWDNHLLTLAGHTKGVSACVFSPDGQTILSGSWDRTLRLWSASTGEALLTLEGHTLGVNSCAFSPDGRRLVSGSDDTTLRLWDAGTGENLGIFKGHTEPVTGVGFSPDGLLLVSSSKDGTLRIWDSNLGGIADEKKGHTYEIRACTHSSNGRIWATASQDHTLRIWDTESDHSVQILRGHDSAVEMCYFSADGRYLVSSGFDATVKIWNTQTWVTTHSLVCTADWAMPGQATVCTISPDGKIVAGATQMNLQLWETSSGTTLQQLEGHTDEIYSIEFSPDGNLLASAGRDKTVRVWNTRNGRLVHTLEGEGFMRVCHFAPNGSWIVSSGGDIDGGHLGIWDAVTGKLLQSLDGHTQQVWACSFSPNGRLLVSFSLDETIRIWDPERGIFLHTIGNLPGYVKEFVFSPDGQILAAIVGKTLHIWDTDDFHLRSRLPLLGNLSALSLHPLYPEIVMGDTSGALYRAKLVGVRYGFVIVTAIDQEDRLFVTCPACQSSFRVQKSQLGTGAFCPAPDCDIRLKINPFVINRK